MDFQPKTANFQGGDTRKTPNLSNHAKPIRGKGPPHSKPFNPSQISKSHTYLSITHIPFNPFQPKYPMGRWMGQGGKASLANTVDADILEYILGKLAARITTKTRTFLVKGT